jgi:hypothetical protein
MLFTQPSPLPPLTHCINIKTCAVIFKQSMGARNRIKIGLSYRPPRLHSLAELVPWNRFLGSLKVKKILGKGMGGGVNQ